MKSPVLIAAALMLTATATHAEEPGQDWISIGRIERMLQAEGYRLTEIEPKGDHWEAEATRHGRTWDFTLSARTGRIITIEPDTD